MTVTHTERHPLPIAGQHVATGEWHPVHSPYSGERIAEVARGGRAETIMAVEAAAEALAEGLPAYRRAELLDAMAELIGARREDFAQTICAEAGKPIKAARVEADRAVTTFRLSAAEARKLTGHVVPMDATMPGTGKLAFTLRRPIGIVGAIAPFNFPLNLVAHKVAPALAAGCPVVLKPAGTTPLTALLLAEVLAEAGLPPGWLNVVVGPAAQIGDVLVEDDRVAMISFTGSADVGWGLRQRAPRKRVSLELGNSTPVIVDKAADLDLAARKTAAHAFTYAGQTCVSIQRVIVHEDVYDEFVGKLVPLVQALRSGDPADGATDVGPVIDEAAATRLRDWLDAAIAAGAQVLAGGAFSGSVLAPTVLETVPVDASLWCDEAFGPVCSVKRYRSLDEAFDLANGTPFGLQAGIFTGSLATALTAADRLQFGGVLINEAPEFRTDQMPYGGVKASGNTKEGPAYTVQEMTEERLVVLEAS